jgi:copper(I)-binding protein
MIRREVRQIGLLITAFVSAHSLALAQESLIVSGPWRLGDVVVEQAWARVVPGGAKTGAVYLTIHNKSANDDLLLAVDSSAAASTAVHESKVVEGVATMEALPFGVVMPSHDEVVMRPGGIHIMMTGITSALKPGDMLPVRMVFREAGTLDFDVPVLPLNAGDPTIKHSGHGG